MRGESISTSGVRDGITSLKIDISGKKKLGDDVLVMKVDKPGRDIAMGSTDHVPVSKSDVTREEEKETSAETNSYNLNSHILDGTLPPHFERMQPSVYEPGADNLPLETDIEESFVLIPAWLIPDGEGISYLVPLGHENTSAHLEFENDTERIHLQMLLWLIWLAADLLTAFPLSAIIYWCFFACTVIWMKNMSDERRRKEQMNTKEYGIVSGIKATKAMRMSWMKDNMDLPMQTDEGETEKEDTEKICQKIIDMMSNMKNVYDLVQRLKSPSSGIEVFKKTVQKRSPVGKMNELFDQFKLPKLKPQDKIIKTDLNETELKSDNLKQKMSPPSSCQRNVPDCQHEEVVSVLPSSDVQDTTKDENLWDEPIALETTNSVDKRSITANVESEQVKTNARRKTGDIRTEEKTDHPVFDQDGCLSLQHTHTLDSGYYDGSLADANNSSLTGAAGHTTAHIQAEVGFMVDRTTEEKIIQSNSLKVSEKAETLSQESVETVDSRQSYPTGKYLADERSKHDADQIEIETPSQSPLVIKINARTNEEQDHGQVIDGCHFTENTQHVVDTEYNAGNYSLGSQIESDRSTDPTSECSPHQVTFDPTSPKDCSADDQQQDCMGKKMFIKERGRITDVFSQASSIQDLTNHGEPYPFEENIDLLQAKQAAADGRCTSAVPSKIPSINMSDWVKDKINGQNIGTGRCHYAGGVRNWDDQVDNAGKYSSDNKHDSDFNVIPVSDGFPATLDPYTLHNCSAQNNCSAEDHRGQESSTDKHALNMDKTTDEVNQASLVSVGTNQFAVKADLITDGHDQFQAEGIPKGWENTSGKQEPVRAPCGDVKDCYACASTLLHHAGCSQKIYKLKRKIVHLMQLGRSQFPLKTVYGLALHCLPKMDQWEIDDLLDIWSTPQQPYETAVHHVLRELRAQGLKLGHLVQYFNMEDSRRLDILELIGKIHPGCKFCSAYISRGHN